MRAQSVQCDFGGRSHLHWKAQLAPVTQLGRLKLGVLLSWVRRYAWRQFGAWNRVLSGSERVPGVQIDSVCPVYSSLIQSIPTAYYCLRIILQCPYSRVSCRTHSKVRTRLNCGISHDYQPKAQFRTRRILEPANSYHAFRVLLIMGLW